MNPIRKYPRTQHLAGSGLQPGDEDLDAVPVSDLRGKYVVVEEKMDGANCGASFGPDCGLLLQSRGHYLLGGPREKQFALFKQWASSLADRLLDRLETRYVLYGEWLYAKHSVYYDLLPHYFLEFDVLDTHTGAFLDTPRRAELLAGLPVAPVKVLYAGEFPGEEALRSFVGPSPVTLHLCVADIDAAIGRAAKAGGTVTMPAEDMFWGDRYGQIVDPFGHAWSFSTPLSAERKAAAEKAWADGPFGKKGAA